MKPGDTPAAIARERLGDAQLWHEIVAVNPGLDPKGLKIGQVLQMPGRGADPGAPAGGRSDASAARSAPPARLAGSATGGAAPTAKAGGTGPDAVPKVPAARTHSVAPGDNLYSVARRYYGDPSLWTLIRDANPSLGDGIRQLKLGTQLVVPAAPGNGR